VILEKLTFTEIVQMPQDAPEQTFERLKPMCQLCSFQLFARFEATSVPGLESVEPNKHRRLFFEDILSGILSGTFTINRGIR
jgi:hypothetical protein